MDKGIGTIISGVVMIAGGAAGMAFGVVDPITGTAFITNGLAILGVNNRLTQIMKDKEINIHVKKEAP
jgi:hypothetical protein